MSVDQRLNETVGVIEESIAAPPVASIRARSRRRQRRSWAVAATTALVCAGIVAAAVAAWPGSPTRATVTPATSPPSPAPGALDFTATVLPAGLHYLSTEHGPPNQFEELIKRYTDGARMHVLIIDVNRGDVMTPKYYADTSGGFTLTTIDGHPAAVGADHGRNAAGNVEVFVQIAANITVDVDDRSGLSLAQVIDVVRGVRVS